MDQELQRWSGSTSSMESHNTDRDSPGTPTPNPRRFKDNSRPAISEAKARERDASDSPTNTSRSPRKLESSSSSDWAAGTDGELSMTSSDLEDPASSNSNEHPVTKVYHQYDLQSFTPQDFDLLLTLAPADQLPDLTTSEVKAEVASDFPDGRSAVRIAIKRYVIFHKFNQDPYASHTTSQRRDFERNVYDYARANGLRKQEALNEVRKARVIGGAPEDDSENSSFGSEVDDTAEILAHLATTTFSYRDLERQGINSEPPIPKRADGDRRKTRRGRKTGGEEHNPAETRNPVADADNDGKGTLGNTNAEPAKSYATNIPSLIGSLPVAGSRSSRRKRKRMDVEAADNATNQPRREAKKSKHFQRVDKKQSTTQQSRSSPDSNGDTMDVDFPLEKDANKPQTTLSLSKGTEKATKKQEKRQRRREKHAAESKGGPHSETKKAREDQTHVVDVAHFPSAKVIDAKPSSSEHLPPAERKKRIKRKSNTRESESRVDAGASCSRLDDEASSKERAPNEPKSEQEAHQNFMRANMHDPQETTLTADKTTQEVAEAEGKQSKLIEELHALKRFSNEKQLQLYDDGKYANADKQTKEDLKDLKEEKTTVGEMYIDIPKIDRGPEKKEKKKGRKSKVKRDKAVKDEESGGNDGGEIKKNRGSNTRAKRRKRGSEKQENVSPDEQAGFQ